MTEHPPAAFHVMAKPTGAACNLACAYCYFLEKERLYPGSSFRMTDEVLESYVRQTCASSRAASVTLSWQGGEPTLMGLDFFRRATEAAKRSLRPGMALQQTLQTNGILLDEAWCDFLRENEFLVGLSIDGPRELHDAFRRDKGGRPVFGAVLRAARLMQRRGVEFNVLCTVNAVNSGRPVDVYRFFRDELRVRYLQLIPIVERAGEGARRGAVAGDRSVRPERFGQFLIEVFDEWFRRDVGEMFVPFFDGVLASWLYGESSLCILRPSCGEELALEHNGDLYACDHFVDPAHLLGNILETPLVELVGSEKQRAFGAAKSASLPHCCRECEYLFTCHGECPKNRILATPDGEPGLNWLCAGLKAFFRHVEQPMRSMAELIRSGRPASAAMSARAGDSRRTAPGPNEPCPCGAPRKYKRCHGRL